MHFFRKAVVLGTGATALYTLQKQKRSHQEEINHIEKKTALNGQDPILELNSLQRRFIPWELNVRAPQNSKDWELRKVKVRGALFGHFHLVYRERKGKPGYLVFRGFKTAHADGGDLDAAEGQRGHPVGMMVNLGWVAAYNVKKLEGAEVNYITKVENDTALPGVFAQIQDKLTGFVYNSEGDDFEHPIEDFNEEEVEISGFLRRGEKNSLLAGRRRFHNQKATSLIDLERMAALYQFNNIYSATNYYLEAATEGSTEEASKDNILIPASFSDIHQNIKAYQNRNLAHDYGFAQAATAIATALGVLIL